MPSPLVILCGKYHLHERGDWCWLLSFNEVACTSPTTVMLHTQGTMLMELELWMVPSLNLLCKVVVGIPLVCGQFINLQRC